MDRKFLLKLQDKFDSDEDANYIYDFFDRYSVITIADNIAWFQCDLYEIRRILRDLAEEIGLEKTKMVADLVYQFQMAFRKEFPDYDREETEKRNAQIEDLLNNPGINFDTSEIEDEERFKKFVLAYYEELAAGNQSRSPRDYINERLSPNISNEKKADFYTRMGQLILYAEMSVPIPDGFLIDAILEDFEISDLIIPPEFTDGFMEQIRPSSKEIGTEIRSITVDKDNEAYSSKDGVLFNKEGNMLLFYPPKRAGKSYIIPDDVDEISRDAFPGEVGELEEILVGNDNEYFKSVDGILYSKDGTELIVYPLGKANQEYIVPSTVISVKAGNVYTSLRKVLVYDVPENNPAELFRAFEAKEMELIPGTLEDAIASGTVEGDASAEEQKRQYDKYVKVLKLSNAFVYSKDYNIGDAYAYARTMFELLGEDETREILRIPKRIENEEITRYCLANEEFFNESYEKKIKLYGPLPVTVDILKYLYGQFGKAAGQKLFQNINDRLDHIGNYDKLDKIILDIVNNLNIRIDTEKFSEVYKEIIKKEYRRNELKIRKTIRDTVNENSYRLNGHLGIIAGMLEKVIYKNYIQEGNIDQAIEILREELQKRNSIGELVYEGLLENQNPIEDILRQVYDESYSIVQNNICEKMQSAKHFVGNRWISRLLSSTNKIHLDDMTIAEFDKFKENVGSGRDEDFFETDSYYAIKPDAAPRDVVWELSNCGYRQLVTYERAERMFSAIRRPYSKNFKKWFMDNKSEILEHADIMEMLPDIHRKFDREIINTNITQTMLDNGLIDVDYVFRKYQQSKGIGNIQVYDMLSNWINKLNLDKKDKLVKELENIYEHTKKREKSYIPSAEKSKKVGKVTYRGRILRADDPLNILIGNATDCCQKINDVGENTMRHASMEDTGRTFVVEEIDENGNSKIVSQSWVWRNNGTLCFDNIEIPVSEHMKLKYGKSEEDIAKQKAILDVYQGAANIALEKDNKKFDELLKKGKITQEQYDAYKLSLVTVGIGLNDLRNLNQF